MNKTNFNDDWTCNGIKVNLPHDAMIHLKRDPKAESGTAQAFFPGGIYKYEKVFKRPDAKHAILQFEGVYKNAKVILNDKEIGGADYGYIPFFVSLDEHLKDGDNKLVVTCDNEKQPDSRWYTGAGIYRPVWLWTGNDNFIGPEAVKIETLSINPATISVKTECNTEVNVEIYDNDKLVASGKGNDLKLSIEDAKLWSDISPYLYKCKVSTNNDELNINFGIRRVSYDAQGLYINGKETLLKGGCLHHDNGILGAATYDESEWRRVKTLKDAGFNAIRSAHNPCSRALLEACDYYGVYVMDEAWDMWFSHKSKYDYASVWKDNYLDDLKAMVNKDFNHPSVIMYSIGNEVSEPASKEGIEYIKKMEYLLHSIDPNRPVTGGFNLMIIANASKGKAMYKEDGGLENNGAQMNGMNSTLFNMITNMVGPGMNKSANSKKADKATSPSLDLLDICGYNYASGRYPLEGKAHPDRLIFGSETFPQDIAKNWDMVKKYPYLIGDFMWAAWDYLGEAGIGAWAYTKDGAGFNKPYPWLLADTGAFDIIGTPNGEAFLAEAVWGTLDKPVICVQPLNHDRKPAKMTWRGTNAIESWSWKNCEGKKAIVEVYSDATSIELFVNGKSLGKKKVKGCKTTFKTEYNPGKIEAVAYDAVDKEVSRNLLTSASSNTSIVIKPEKEVVKANEIVYINVHIADGNGVIESNNDQKLTIEVKNGELLGFGSANPRTEERFDEGTYTTYYGNALAIIKANGSGELTVKVSSKDSSIEKIIKVD